MPKATARKKNPPKKMDPEKKARLIKTCGLFVAIFTIFTLIACLSYLFTWKPDQSVLRDPAMMSQGVDVHNAGGKLGVKWGHLLVENCFGLASFAIVAMLGYISICMMRLKRPSSITKLTLLFVSGTILGACILSFISALVSPDVAFGGGLGGYMGSSASDCLKNLIGSFGTGLLLAFLLVVWLLFASGAFAKWFTHVLDPKPEKEEQPDAPEAEFEAETTTETDAAGTAAEDSGEIVADGDGAVVEIMDTPEGEVPAEDSQSDDADVTADSGSVVSDTMDLDTEVVETVPGYVPGPDDIVYQDGEDSKIEVTEGFEAKDITVVEHEDFTEEVEELERYDNRAELSKFKFPPIDLLESYESGIHKVPKSEIENNNMKIQTTLISYKIQVESVSAIVGPTVTLYKVKLAPGMRSAAVKNIEKDIAMALGNESVRVTILADAVGIEVANDVKSIVPLRAMFNDDSFRESKAELPVALGYTITQKVKTFDLADAPHLLVAGATKQGKSVGLNVIVASLLYSKHPSELKFVFVDPKMVEFTAYKKLLNHYLAVLPEAASEEEEKDNAIVKDHKKADEVLKSLCIEMDDRYLLLSKAGVNKLADYNEKYSERHLNPKEGHRYLPYLVVVIDEYADLIMAAGGSDGRNIAKGVTTSIVRLAQKGRAAGIHVIIATQRPSVDVITGLIKTNFPTRIAFRVVTRVDSGTILDSPGAEKLIGRGDMLYYEGIKMERVQCAYVSTEEINKITSFIGDQMGYKAHYNTPYYLPEVPVEGGEGGDGASMVDMNKLDSNFEEAARLVVTTQRGSTSDIQRRLGMGYARAGKVMDQLEAAGIVGPQEGSKPRQVLVSDLAELDGVLQAFGVK